MVRPPQVKTKTNKKADRIQGLNAVCGADPSPCTTDGSSCNDLGHGVLGQPTKKVDRERGCSRQMKTKILLGKNRELDLTRDASSRPCMAVKRTFPATASSFKSQCDLGQVRDSGSTCVVMRVYEGQWNFDYCGGPSSNSESTSGRNRKTGGNQQQPEKKKKEHLSILNVVVNPTKHLYPAQQ